MNSNSRLHLTDRLNRWVTFITVVLLLCTAGCRDSTTSAARVVENATEQRRDTIIEPRSDVFLPRPQPAPPQREQPQPQPQPQPATEERPGQDLAPPNSVRIDTAGRYLIIHADDAGMCRAVNRGTIDVLEAGVVTSASIMVPCPGFAEFAAFAASHPEYDYGIHLTLNAEFEFYRWGPVLPANEVPSLVDRKGLFWQTGEETAATARADDVERELRAQIERALEFGVPLTHLDTHMGTLFRRPDFIDIYLQLGTDYNLPVLLPKDDGFLRQLEIDRDMTRQLRNGLEVLRESGFPSIDTVFMHYRQDSAASKRRVYLNWVRRAPVGVSEIVIHCARDDREIRSITRHYRVRTRDREVFTDPTMMDEIRRSGVQLINWKQLHQLTRHGCE